MKFIQPIDVVAGQMTSNAVDEVLSAWAIGTTYANLAQVKYENGIYESRQAANTGHTPTFRDSDDWWRYMGPLNSWAPFDPTVETQVEAPGDTWTCSLNLGKRVNGIAFLNCAASSIRVVMTDPIDGVVYDHTENMSSTQGINNFYRWLFTPIDRRKNLVLLDLPMYPNAVIDVTMVNVGGTARCGVLSLGVVKRLGHADYGTSRSIRSFSKIKENEFGQRVITKRSYAKRMTVPVSVDRLERDYVVRQLEDNMRDVPGVWIAEETIESTIIFGPYESFDHVISTWDMDRNQLVIQGFV